MPTRGAGIVFWFIQAASKFSWNVLDDHCIMRYNNWQIGVRVLGGISSIHLD